MMKKIILSILALFFFSKNYSQVNLSRDTFGNYVTTDQYGNIIATYSKNPYGEIEEKDQYGNVISRFSKNPYGQLEKKDQDGNVIFSYSQNPYGETEEKDQYGNTVATFSKNPYGQLEKKDQYGNVIATYTTNTFENGFFYDNSRPPAEYNKYINPVNTALMENVLKHLENTNRQSNKSESQINKEFVNSMLYKYDEKLFEKSQKNKKKEDKLSIELEKDIYKRSTKNQLLDINSLSNGWYTVVAVVNNIYYNRKVEVMNNTIVNWINSLEIIFPTSNFKKTYSGYSAVINMPDGANQNVDVYFLSNKPLEAPKHYEPCVVLFYTTEFIDGDMLYIRVYGNEINQLQGLINSWTGDAQPKCSDDRKVLKFYLPKGQKIDFHANTQTKFWKGEIETNKFCTSLKLN